MEQKLKGHSPMMNLRNCILDSLSDIQYYENSRDRTGFFTCTQLPELSSNQDRKAKWDEPCSGCWVDIRDIPGPVHKLACGCQFHDLCIRHKLLRSNPFKQCPFCGTTAVTISIIPNIEITSQLD